MSFAKCPPMSSAPQPAIKRRNGSSHDRTGCLTCRRRRKKCVDNIFPVCGTCLRLNLQCVREPARSVVPSSWSRQLHPPSPTPTCLQSPMPASVPIETPQKRHCMGYYIAVLTRHLTVSEKFNSFLSAFLPMAMESVVLSDALLALASGHLSLVNKAYKVTALEARSNAIRNLAAAISTPSNMINRHETNAAACLAFVISEVGTGDCKGWYNHLQGTKNIIMSATAYSASGKVLHGPDAFKTSPEGQWVLRNFAYHDIVGSVTLRKRPLLDGSYLAGITDVVDSYLGVATELLCFLAKISCLDEYTKFNEHLPGEEVIRRKALFHSTCASLEKQLRDWHCHPAASPGLAAVAYAFRSAVLIVFYRLVRSRLYPVDIGREDLHSKSSLIDIVQSKIHTQVTNTLSHVADIPIGTTPESALLLPLFLAGGEAREEGHIDAVRQRLRMTLEKRQFQNVSRALEVLEDLWELRKDQNGIEADWSHILDTTRGDLLLT
ncbi:hypothetical protein G7Z17_g7903 [Cylindrodendrum hubeiense]|uniref:Zn(2)-C6 fungal-type domain-containing protein n=1 Tax=Cylindrodendrum hubeiense TaxID=595255 RepID=A0A9P5H861_9HYPO|nr:hypothetical protein G7Z17_g7903 [Cylindrodendrum hubeiense]